MGYAPKLPVIIIKKNDFFLTLLYPSFFSSFFLSLFSLPSPLLSSLPSLPFFLFIKTIFLQCYGYACVPFFSQSNFPAFGGSWGNIIAQMSRFEEFFEVKKTDIFCDFFGESNILPPEAPGERIFPECSDSSFSCK